MNAYAVVAAFDPNFTDHDWAVTNIKEAGLANDFSTVWPNATDDILELQNLDDVVYFYGTRGGIYKALAKFGSFGISNLVHGRRYDPIHAYRAEVKVTGGRIKQIIMLAVANPTRDRELAALRDPDLEESSPTYWMDIFRSRMEKKWPNKLGGDD